MNRRRFLKWIGGITAVIAAPKAEAVAKEIVKATESPKPKLVPNPFQGVGCYSGSFPVSGMAGRLRFDPLYDSSGNFFGWGQSFE